MLTGNKTTDILELKRLAENEERSAIALRAIGRWDQARSCDAAAARFRAQAQEMGRC